MGDGGVFHTPCVCLLWKNVSVGGGLRREDPRHNHSYGSISSVDGYGNFTLKQGHYMVTSTYIL
jgi:hypothetical protein